MTVATFDLSICSHIQASIEFSMMCINSLTETDFFYIIFYMNHQDLTDSRVFEPIYILDPDCRTQIYEFTLGVSGRYFQ